MQISKITIFCLVFGIVGCSRAPLKSVSESMRFTNETINISDSLSKESFFEALSINLAMIKKSNKVSDPMVFGSTKIAKSKYIEYLEKLLYQKDNSDWIRWIQDNFDFYEVYGNEKWGEVLSTGYYEPHVFGSYKPTVKYSEPIYSPPKNLVRIDLKSFQDKFSTEIKMPTLTGRIENKKFLPFYDRKEISTDKALRDQNLELVYLDPIDAFFIEIQGSGVIEFEDGSKIRIGYAEQNGHSYVPIGKFLKDVIPLEKMSMQRIRNHLKTLSLNEQQEILNKNPSYVFFKKLDSKALTYSGAEVVDGRTIATDKEFFPKGAMAFLEIKEPVFENLIDIDPKDFIKKPRLVFDQDTGGAIKGGGRVDLFMGSSEEAAQKAGVFKEIGRLFYLVPKK